MDDDRGNLGAIFAAHANADRPAIIDLSDQAAPREITYAALDAACDAVARGLTARGLKEGDRIAILGLNRHEYIAVMFGAMRAGVVPAPINIKLPARGVAEIAHDAGAKLMFADAGARALCPPEPPVIAFDGKSGGDYASFGDPGPFTPVAPGAGGVAFQPYTSGSTGRPKGVLLSHKAHLWVARTLAENRGIWRMKL